MLQLPHFTCCFLLLLLPLITCSNSKLTTVYDVLRAHGLPMGLLPKGVVDFEVDDAGRFTAHLDQACNAKFESELHYDRNVSGTLSFGRIGSLSGISAQELFLWFPVKGIRIDVPSSGIIYFDVGVVYKQFSLSLFETPPDCTAASGSFEAIGTVSKSKSGKLRSKLNYELGGRYFG
ncbi:hypothetical protein EV1_003730 [Malus domestica]|uniref:DUF538 domain-containing protein n=1 Tax=Malus baccata TaxID=106549 RepID=A0A540KXG0_MALBA|nr:uncharacterized protein LOC103429558 [Malus domestica]TQD78910.1 hypothetical protein C1H46_035540 [Malus baccata]